MSTSRVKASKAALARIQSIPNEELTRVLREKQSSPLALAIREISDFSNVEYDLKYCSQSQENLDIPINIEFSLENSCGFFEGLLKSKAYWQKQKENNMNNDTFIKAETVVRDGYGFWIHPSLPPFDESTTTKEFNTWFNSQGLKHEQVLLSDQMEESEWVDGNIEVVKNWEPKSDYNYSFLVGIWDTEDGVVASFAYPITSSQSVD